MGLEATLKFLKALEANNSKEWMDAHRATYETEKQRFEALVAELISGLEQMERAYGDLQPKQCIFRLNRDIRFSKDKSPYKTNFGAAFALGGKKSGSAGFYVHLQHNQSFIAGGHWMPDAEQLRKIRQEIDYNFEAFQEIVQSPSFKKYFKEMGGEKLARPPKGYAAEHPAIYFLKHKSFTLSHPITNSEVADPKFAQKVLQVFEAMRPFVDFLNHAVQ